MPELNKISYLDSASTTKLDERVLKEMLPYFTKIYGNSSSAHEYGKVAKNSINKARKQVAELINAKDDEIIFTSGSTEAINLAIKGYIEANADKGNHIITVKTEHKAVLATCEYLETKGVEVTYLDVNNDGLICLNKLREAIKETTILIAIMFVNNETGVIQPIKEIGKISKAHNITFLSDATQAVGKIPVDVIENNIDMLCFSAHKLNGPKGVGVLYKSNKTNIEPLIHGGGQERGKRSGTYNTPSIVGFGKACELCLNEINDRIKTFKYLNNYLIKSINCITRFDEISKQHLRIPNIIVLIIPDLDSDILISKYKTLAVSNGSACNSELLEDSHVLKAIFLGKNLKNNYIRISFDRYTSKEDIDVLIEILKIHLKKIHA